MEHLSGLGGSMFDLFRGPYLNLNKNIKQIIDFIELSDLIISYCFGTCAGFMYSTVCKKDFAGDDDARGRRVRNVVLGSMT